MPHDLGKNVVAFVHRANPGDGGVARSARFRISIEIETASKSQFCLAVQNVGVHPTSNVGTVVNFSPGTLARRDTCVGHSLKAADLRMICIAISQAFLAARSLFNESS